MATALTGSTENLPGEHRLSQDDTDNVMAVLLRVAKMILTLFFKRFPRTLKRAILEESKNWVSCRTHFSGRYFSLDIFCAVEMLVVHH